MTLKRFGEFVKNLEGGIRRAAFDALVMLPANFVLLQIFLLQACFQTVFPDSLTDFSIRGRQPALE